MPFFLYDRCDDAVSPLTTREADRDHRDTDAGNTHEPFVVEAKDAGAALEAARRWVACWADETQKSVPDDLMLTERVWGKNPWKTYHHLSAL